MRCGSAVRMTQVLSAKPSWGRSSRAPQGLIKIDEDTGHTHLWPRIGKVNAHGQFDVIREAVSSVKPDPYSPFVGEKNWSMRSPDGSLDEKTF